MLLHRADATASSPLTEPVESAPSPVNAGVEEWIGCIATRTRCAADARAAATSSVLCALGNVAWRLGRPLVWDEETGRFDDDAGADRLLDAPRRLPWRI